jgi:hypothetical protein
MDTNSTFEPPYGQTRNTGTGINRPAQGSAIDETKQKVQEAATAAQQKVGDQLRSSVDSGKTRAANSLDSIAQALTQSSEQLRNQNAGAPSEYVQRAGDQIRRASDYLRNTNVDEIVYNTENFARRQPGLFLAGAFAIGLLGARFLKSSQRNELEEQQKTTGSGYGEPTSQSQFRGDRERPLAGRYSETIPRRADERGSEPL